MPINDVYLLYWYCHVYTVDNSLSTREQMPSFSVFLLVFCLFDLKYVLLAPLLVLASFISAYGTCTYYFYIFFPLYFLSTMLSSSYPFFITLISHIFSLISLFPFHSPHFLRFCWAASIYFFRYFFCHISLF